MKRILISILAFYQYWLSPAIHAIFPSGCRFQPTCSYYASEAIATHGAGRGSWLAARRLLRCHPFRRGGYDPVPPPSQKRADAADSRGEAMADPLP
jgi:uncharacterized protein